MRISDFVGDEERSSLFNKRERSIWWLPRKPTLFYMYDVIARSQLLSRKKKWWIQVPSGQWRVVWGYVQLAAAIVDVVRCTTSLTFCGAPYTGIDLALLQCLFLGDVVVRLISALPQPAGILELDPAKIFLHHLRSGGLIIDIACLLPLELVLPRCWPDDWSTCNPVASRSGAQLLSWQWVHLLRFFGRWRTCDTFRSVTSTDNDGPLQVIKYAVLVFMAAHLACCLFYWASIGLSAPPLCSHTDLNAMAWEPNVKTVLAMHNAIDPFNQLLVDSGDDPFRVSSLQVPSDDDEAFSMAREAQVQLYTFWFYAAFAALLGDAFGAKNMVARICAVIFLLGGQVTFAVVIDWLAD